MTLVCLEESNIVKGEYLQHVIQDQKLIVKVNTPDRLLEIFLYFLKRLETFSAGKGSIKHIQNNLFKRNED